VAIPGTVKGLNTALKRYGTMSREEVMQGAITLAREGFILSEEDIQRFERELPKWKEQLQIAEIFLKDGQFPYPDRRKTLTL
jgi:gamma-glutamyltranspeptidase/glutathione hydrolase